MDVSSWIKEHREDSLIQAIQTSDFRLFTSILDSGVDVNSHDYLYSRDGRLPTLPIHIAAAHPDSRFLRLLIDRGADPNDSRAYPLGVYPEFDNVFRTAVRAGLWENVDVVIDAGGVHGDIGIDLMWELHSQSLREEVSNIADDEVREELETFIQRVLRMTTKQLCEHDYAPHLTHNSRPPLHWNSASCSITNVHADLETHHELTNLAWMISTSLPKLDEVRRISIIDRLLSAGADVSC